MIDIISRIESGRENVSLLKSSENDWSSFMLQDVDAELSFVSNMPKYRFFQARDVDARRRLTHWFYVCQYRVEKQICCPFVPRRYTTCSARVRAIGRRTARRRGRRTYSRRWMRTTTGSWRRMNSWRAASRTRSCRRCSLLNPDVAALPGEPSTRDRKGHHDPHRLPQSNSTETSNAGNNKAITETDTRKHTRIIYTRDTYQRQFPINYDIRYCCGGSITRPSLVPDEKGTSSDNGEWSRMIDKRGGTAIQIESLSILAGARSEKEKNFGFLHGWLRDSNDSDVIDLEKESLASIKQRITASPTTARDLINFVWKSSSISRTRHVVQRITPRRFVGILIQERPQSAVMELTRRTSLPFSSGKVTTLVVEDRDGSQSPCSHLRFGFTDPRQTIRCSPCRIVVPSNNTDRDQRPCESSDAL